VSADLERLLVGFTDAIAQRVASRLAEELPPSPAVEPEWRLVDETTAAALLGRSPRWLRERRRAGALPWIKLDGRGAMYDVDDLRAFAAARRVPSAAELDGRHLQAVEFKELRP
jgi:hypothetical protein